MLMSMSKKIGNYTVAGCVTNVASFSDRSYRTFRVDGPCIRNSLPVAIRNRYLTRHFQDSLREGTFVYVTTARVTCELAPFK